MTLLHHRRYLKCLETSFGLFTGTDIVTQNPFEISTTATSSIGVLVADLHGSIHILDKHFEITRSWVAHVGGRVTHMSERKGILISMGVSRFGRRLPDL